MFFSEYIYEYTYVHVKTVYERRGHEFAKEQGGSHGRAWEEEVKMMWL